MSARSKVNTMITRGNRQILGIVKGHVLRRGGPPRDSRTRVDQTVLSPYALARKYASGEISRSDMVRKLSVWPYKPSQTHTDGHHDDLLVYVPGSFDDVERAVNEGLIDDDAFDEIADAYEASTKAASRNQSVLGGIKVEAKTSGLGPLRGQHVESPFPVTVYVLHSDSEVRKTIAALKVKHIPFQKIDVEKNAKLQEGLSYLGFSECHVVLKDGDGRTWAGSELKEFIDLPLSLGIQQGI